MEFLLRKLLVFIFLFDDLLKFFDALDVLYFGVPYFILEKCDLPFEGADQLGLLLVFLVKP